VLSAARPKIADYPFTTLVPNLGVVRRPSGDGTVFADIPGLIAGASRGAGLGHAFLRHIERTRILIHLLDAGSEDVVSDLKVVEAELKAYGHGLEGRPRLVVLNKIDVVPPEDLEALTEAISQSCGDQRPLLISAATSKGLDILLVEVWKQLKQVDEVQQILENSAKETLSTEVSSIAAKAAYQSS
jgi:GTP-binding protein